MLYCPYPTHSQSIIIPYKDIAALIILAMAIAYLLLRAQPDNSETSAEPHLEVYISSVVLISSLI